MSNHSTIAQADTQTIQHIETILQRQRDFFKTKVTLDLGFREQQLQLLKQAITKYEPQIEAALRQDLNKSKAESYMSEISLVYEEINFMLKHLRKLMKPRRVISSLLQFPAKSSIHYEPYGMVLNIAPWNYPFQLCIAPIVGAMAAGNTLILKPSELAPHTAEVIAALVAEYFDADYFTVIQGDVSVNQALLRYQFDYIFFTGSTKVGKIIMQAASHYLTPVTLELGGKSPCIVDATADITQAAKSIIWGKTLNSGQTCVAPDYLLVHHTIKDKLIAAMQVAITDMFGQEPLNNPDYPKIITQPHYDRVKSFLTNGKVVIGGTYRDSSCQIAPTVLDEVDWQSPVMQEEIFAPILPMLSFEHFDEVIEQITARDKPLALYLFTQDKVAEQRVLTEVSFGGGCINDTLLHLTNNNLPFGGVGASGMGSYHGGFSFYTFSHAKGILRKGKLDIPLRYPPYTLKKLKFIKTLIG